MPNDRYDRSIKVNQSTIDRIKKMGMGEAMKAANAGTESAEFVEGAKRMYGGNRVKEMNTANLSRRQEENKSGANTGRAAPSVDGEGGRKPASGGPRMKPSGPSQAAVGRRLDNNKKSGGMVGALGGTTKGNKTPFEALGSWLADKNEKSNVPLPWNRPKDKQDTAFSRMGITNKDKKPKQKSQSAWEQAAGKR